MPDKSIRVRVCLAVIQDDRILLVPHFDTDAGPIQWNTPGGRIEFGESLHQAAKREFQEETGITAEISGLLDVSEVIIPEREWHSITITYIGKGVQGALLEEADHPYGRKFPRWFTFEELKTVKYHPLETIQKAMEMIKGDGRDG
jgi:8-oxo-dGTP diphosphatase